MGAKLVVLYLLYLITLIQGHNVPCLFNIGDSGSDNGNNNNLFSLAKSNYLPYGIDYPHGPTGRFTNGRTYVDFMAEYLGFEKPIPPFVIANGVEILRGVNYASGAAGILDDTGKIQGARVTMRQQLLNHKLTISKIGVVLGNQSLAEEHVSKCLYLVNIGTNEYANNYLLPPFYSSSLLYTPHQFAAIVIKAYSQQLRNLYNYGARKIVVYGSGPIGCAPQFVSKNGSTCDESLNKVVQPFNQGLPMLIDDLNADLAAAEFILINSTSIFLSDHSKYGIKVKNAPCCKVIAVGLCEMGGEICSNRNEYFFWDNFHVTENGERILAERSYDAHLPTDAYPFDIRHLVQN